jgi:hypothetical protein
MVDDFLGEDLALFPAFLGQSLEDFQELGLFKSVLGHGGKLDDKLYTHKSQHDNQLGRI